MSERQEHRQRLNARIAYAAAIERWAKNQPSRIRFFAVRRWLKEMPRKEDFYEAERGMMLVSQTGSLKRSIPSAAGTASTGRETKTLCVCCIPSLTQMSEATRARLFAWK